MDHDQLIGELSRGGGEVTLVAHALDELALEADGAWTLEHQLRNLVGGIHKAGFADDSVASELVACALDAVMYRLRFVEGRTSFAPFLTFADGTTQPAHVEAQASEVVARWKALFVDATSAVWRSRLGHLLVASGRLVGRERVDVADAAIAGYLSIGSEWGQGLDGIDALRAALALSRQFRLTERRAEVLSAIVAAVESALKDSEPKAGIVLGLTRTLVDQPDAPGDVDALLDRARGAFADDPHRHDDVIAQQLHRARSDPVRRSELWRSRVDAWLDAGEREEGMRRAVFLQTAVEHAASSGDRELRQRATARMQLLTIGELGLESVSTSMVLRGEDIARAVRPVTDAPDWRSGLVALAGMGPPTGNTAENRRVVEAQGDEFVFSALFPITKVGGDGLIRFTAETDEERAEYRLSQHEIFNLQMQAPLAAEALLRFPSHHDLPSVDELAAHFAASPVVDMSLGLGLARSFHRWWAGDFEGAAFTVVPRIETLVRNLLLGVNEGIYRLQRQSTPGQYPGLGYLLGVLRAHGLDESWHRYLSTLLVNPTGMNLRNELLHGFVGDVDLVVSALFLQVSVYLTCLGLSSSPSNEA